ncbi:MAG: leucine--tRNA ligase [Phycisphaeraceae bacterium]|nr:leucine--tRNA ligase [Phycisphaerales bacterium]MCB9860085.1 leucine--tRNA ligase [Phycisphaeraceae bacterium]
MATADTPTSSQSPAAKSGGPDTPAFRYTAQLAGTIETAWQAKWEKLGTFVQPNPGDANFDASRPKFYCLDMFPYPSGVGLHVGHPEGYTATDIICRYMRMTGCNVLHPMGFDAFGLPAEQHAIRTGQHPATFTRGTIDNFRRQLKRFGFCYDWSREFATIDPEYYKWTQWIFIKIYNAWYDETARGSVGSARAINELVDELQSGKRPAKLNPDAAEFSAEEKEVDHGDFNALSYSQQRRIIDSYRLAYIGMQTVNWCPKLGTALANEEVIDGRSERGSFPVFRKPMRQWMFRITAYAQRLLDDLDTLDWPSSTIAMQSSWIGRSEGAEIDFALAQSHPSMPAHLRVYTTRPDTVFGATYMVVAPEHPLVASMLDRPAPGADIDAIRAYVDEARNRSDVERQENKKKTGVFLGINATNPATGQQIPVWCADYVLMGYGHGAIMAVPAHDDRDYAFAEKFGLPIRDVVYPPLQAAMAYYCAHASDEERIGSWRVTLADFLGLTTSMGTRPEWYGEALNTVRSRRSHTGDESERKPPEDKNAPQRNPRGAIQATMLETIQSMGAATFDEFHDLILGGAVSARAGIAYTGPGLAVNSASDRVSINFLPTKDAKQKIVDHFESRNVGRKKINFKLRDWLFSRQRYWGEPFPIVFDEDGNHHAIGEATLPLELPSMDDYAPAESEDPSPLLAKATDWLHTTAGNAGVAGLPADAHVTREANTMPGWAGSCWYYLRYIDPKNHDTMVDAARESYWMGKGQRLDATNRPDNRGAGGGVDLYMGGAEHAVLHLLYARFWHKILFDLGHVSTTEPMSRLYHQGMILSFAYMRKDKSLVPIDEVEETSPDTFIEKATGEPVTQTIAKMSKSLRNVINPDDVIAEYGADTFRLYEMYMGPLDQSKPWNPRDIVGCFRFLQRVWRVCVDENTGDLRTAEKPDNDIERVLHKTIAKVGSDIEKISFNTAIAAMIEFVNACKPGQDDSAGILTASQMERFMQILAPFAPHIAEEVWAKLGFDDCVSCASWPEFDKSMLVEDQIELAVQVNGKVRCRISVPADATEDQVKEVALCDDAVIKAMDGKEIRKLIVVPKRLVNIVV